MAQTSTITAVTRTRRGWAWITENARGAIVIVVHEDYVVDEQGHRKAVVVALEEWEQILDALEELDDIRAYDEAKSDPSDAVPFEQAALEIREGKAE